MNGWRTDDSFRDDIVTRIPATPTTPTRRPSAYTTAHQHRLSLTMTRSITSHPNNHYAQRTMNSGLGGFPMPNEIFRYAMQHLMPEGIRSLTHRTRRDREHTGGIEAQSEDLGPGPILGNKGSKLFLLNIRRNSHGLSAEQKEELGGIEYRASRLLLIIVCCVSPLSLRSCSPMLPKRQSVPYSALTARTRIESC